MQMQGCAWAPPPRVGGEAREGPRRDLVFAEGSKIEEVLEESTEQQQDLGHRTTVKPSPMCPPL